MSENYRKGRTVRTQTPNFAAGFENGDSLSFFCRVEMRMPVPLLVAGVGLHGISRVEFSQQSLEPSKGSTNSTQCN